MKINGDKNDVDLIVPPHCQMVDLSCPDYITVERLQKIFDYFLNFPRNKENVYKYLCLWTTMNDMFKSTSNQEIKTLCCGIGTEICQCFIDKSEKYDKPFLIYNYQELYFNVASLFKNSFYCKDKNYIMNYHILEVFVQKGLLNLNIFRNFLYDEICSSMLEAMFEQLLNLYIIWRDYDNVKNLIYLGLTDLFKSASLIVKTRSFLRITLMPLVTGSITIRYLAEKLLKKLTIAHLKTFTELTAQSIVLKKTSDLFNGKELQICEKLITMQDKNTDLFDALMFVVTKEVMNKNHPKHEQVTAILMASIVVMSKEIKSEWNTIQLTVKRKMILMVLKLKQILIGPKYYPKLLIRYGAEMLENAPSVEIKFHYFQIFKHYGQKCIGDEREDIIKIFDEYLRKQQQY